MIDKVKATVNSGNLIPKGSTVIVALSGGSDSMALLYLLNKLKSEYDLNLRAAHVNHCLRGNDADRDEEFVVRKCRELSVSLDVLKVDVAKAAAENGEGLEECGRRIRYEFFDSLGDDIIIATAHNLSDRIETFLFNFARGSALRGLCSIPVKRNNIIRPLIDCTKSEIIDYCNANGIEYVTDNTNSDVKYTRNRIRHNIISELYKVNSSFEQVAARCISSVNEDEMYLSSLADNLIEDAKTENGYDVNVLANAPVPLKKRALVRICESEANVTPEQKFLPLILELFVKGGSLQINGGVTIRVRKGMLDFPSESAEIESIELKNGAVFGNKIIETEIVNINEINYLQNISKHGLEFFVDCDKILGRAFVRSREPGDKITFKSRNCTKTLKKLFNELSVPPETRNNFAVIADDAGVFAVEGVGCDTRVCISEKTKNVLKIKIKIGAELNA